MALMGNISRRKAVASGAAALAAAALPAHATSPDEVGASGPFVVTSKSGRNGSPWIIRGVTPIEVKVSGQDVDGRFATILVNTPPGRGPELHVHLHQNELFYVVAGRIGLQCGAEKMVLNTGDTFMAPMKVPHAYVTLGTETASMLNVFDPAGDIERFFSGYVKALNTDGPPDPRRMQAINEDNGLKIVGPPLSTSLFGA
jgi:mannose-6-phosphate isomerase-like protein (cupin superfamily)